MTHIVLEGDGTFLDEDDVLFTLEKTDTVMALSEGEMWEPPSKVVCINSVIV